MSDVAREKAEIATSSEDGGDVRASRPRRGKPGPALRGIFLLVGLCLLALVGGFVAFATHVVRAVPPVDPHADGIVVLTGGASRIDGALQLLADGHGDRLLISGVNPTVTRSMLAATINGDLDAAFECCADLDHRAMDTVGNANEAARWVKTRGFTSLIVVTSAYHMPRSMAELGRAMPGIALIAYPITNPDLHLGAWWHDPTAFALLVREYSKFLVAEARQAFTPGVAAE
jgi:uncharacterized SAM-binding protein YcdF (DUF218 family)